MKGSSLIFSHMDTQCTQCHLFTTQFIFSPFYCDNLVIYKVSVHIWVYFGKNLFFIVSYWTEIPRYIEIQYECDKIYKLIVYSLMRLDNCINHVLMTKIKIQAIYITTKYFLMLFEVIVIPWISISDVCSFASSY